MGMIAFFQRQRANKLLADQNSILLTGRTVRQAQVAAETASWHQTAKGRAQHDRAMRFWSRWSDGHPGAEATQELRDLAARHEHHAILSAVFAELIERRSEVGG